MLELLQWGIKDPTDLQWVTVPPTGAVSQAIDLLNQLGAMDEAGITKRGTEMVRLPTHPRIAHMLTHGKLNATEKSLATDVAALIEERDPLGDNAGADLTLRVEALRRWRSGERTAADRSSLERIERVAANWRRFLKVDVDNKLPADCDVGKLLLSAYPERVARQNSKQSEHYTLTNGLVVKLPPHDPLIYQPWLCAAQLDSGRGEGRIFIAAPVHETDLEALAKIHMVFDWDDAGGRVKGREERRIGNVMLSSKPIAIIPEGEAAQIICNKVRESELRILEWGEGDNDLQARILSLRAWRPSEGWPDVSSKHLMNTTEEWLIPYLSGVRSEKELKRLDKVMMLRGLLSWDLQKKLDTLAPARIEVPTGSMIQVGYSPEGATPVLEVRLQELFGLLDTPTVNDGRTKVLLHLLSPGYKPVQVTQDLRSFWQGAYHEVRNELRRRYPKHSWPDDPFSATPVRGARRRTS